MGRATASVLFRNLGNPFKSAISATVNKSIAREWLPIDTDLLLIITTTADELFGGANIDDLERP